MYICIYVCVDVYVCMYIYLYVCMPVHVYAYMHGCIYMCTYMCMCVCIYIYVYVCVYIYICISISRVSRCSLFHLALGNEDGWVQLVYESACCLAWGAIFDIFSTEGKIVVLSVPFLFLTRVGVYVCVSVCIRTHTHTLHRCSDVIPGVGMRHLEGPKNPDGLNLDLHIFVYVYKVHM